MKIIILGAGPSGLGTAFYCKKYGIDFEIYEKENEVGGLCRTKSIDGFLFDYGIHILWAGTEENKKLINEIFEGQKINYAPRKSYICYQENLVPYPFQANIGYLPKEHQYECILEFIKAIKKDPQNFVEWVETMYGKGIAKYFMIPFNKKLWQYSLEEITAKWCQHVPKPVLEDVLQSAILGKEKSFGDNALMGYPEHNGIQNLFTNLANQVGNIHLNKEVLYIYPDKKTILFKDKTSTNYDILVNTISLKDLENRLDVPWNMCSSLGELRTNTVYVIMLGIKGYKAIGNFYDHWEDITWIYYHEPQYMWYRIHISTDLPAKVAPDNTTGLVIEVPSYEPGKNHMPLNYVLESTINNLCNVGILKNKSDIITKSIKRLCPAYVIFTHSRDKIVNETMSYLESKHIFCIGRYGKWQYVDMLSCIKEGKHLIENFKIPGYFALKHSKTVKE